MKHWNKNGLGNVCTVEWHHQDITHSANTSYKDTPSKENFPTLGLAVSIGNANLWAEVARENHLYQELGLSLYNNYFSFIQCTYFKESCTLTMD